jgi:hypothetical protein
MLSQPVPVAHRKRSRSPSPDAEPQPQPLPSRALPEAVWGDYLLPLLTRKDAARLGRTCKALRGVVREHFKDIGTVGFRKLQAALTTFPRARTVALDDPSWHFDAKVREAMLQWLREGGRGKHLERVAAYES